MNQLVLSNCLGDLAIFSSFNYEGFAYETRHIDWHAHETRGKIGAVIEVEPAQLILIGFTIATVL